MALKINTAAEGRSVPVTREPDITSIQRRGFFRDPEVIFPQQETEIQDIESRNDTEHLVYDIDAITDSLGLLFQSPRSFAKTKDPHASRRFLNEADLYVHELCKDIPDTPVLEGGVSQTKRERTEYILMTMARLSLHCKGNINQGVLRSFVVRNIAPFSIQMRQEMTDRWRYDSDTVKLGRTSFIDTEQYEPGHSYQIDGVWYLVPEEEAAVTYMLHIMGKADAPYLKQVLEQRDTYPDQFRLRELELHKPAVSSLEMQLQQEESDGLGKRSEAELLAAVLHYSIGQATADGNVPELRSLLYTLQFDMISLLHKNPSQILKNARNIWWEYESEKPYLLKPSVFTPLAELTQIYGKGDFRDELFAMSYDGSTHKKIQISNDFTTFSFGPVLVHIRQANTGNASMILEVLRHNSNDTVERMPIFACETGKNIEPTIYYYQFEGNTHRHRNLREMLHPSDYPAWIR